MHLEICDNPIFVVGAPRSGTSMMQWALRQHPELWGGQESDYLIPLVDTLAEVYASGAARGRLHWLSGQGVSWPEFLEHVAYGINALYMNRSKGLRWVEQTPQYTLRMNDMATMFPGAVFAYMLRDGRSVVQSLRNFVNPVDHDEACRIWRTSVDAGLDFRDSDKGDRLHIVSYEEVVTHTDRAMRRLYDFLGMDHESRSVGFITRRSPINSSFQGEEVAGKIAPRWAGWTEEERLTFHKIAGDRLIELGFEEDDSWVEETVA